MSQPAPAHSSRFPESLRLWERSPWQKHPVRNALITSGLILAGSAAIIFSVPPLRRAIFGQVRELLEARRLSCKIAEGTRLLKTYLPNCDQSDLDLFRRAASGSVRKRIIGVDLDETVGIGGYRSDLGKPEFLSFDQPYSLHPWESVVFFPYRGMLAVLMGLRAAGNRLILQTNRENRYGHISRMLDPHPLMKVVFDLVPAENPALRVSQEMIAASHQVVDFNKREEFIRRLIAEKPREWSYRDFWDVLDLDSRPVKMPVPGYLYDVLIDDWEFGTHLERLGFGNRWIPSPRSAEGLLKALEDYFSRPIPPMDEDIGRWVQSLSS